MLEIVILAVIVMALYRKHGESWEWSRARLRRAFSGLVEEGDRALERTHRSFPQLLAQCMEDVRSLLTDLTGVLDPALRHRLHRRTRGLLMRSERTGRGTTLDAMPSSGSAAQHPAPPVRVHARLQRRYLEGGISLDEYVEEAGRVGRES